MGGGCERTSEHVVIWVDAAALARRAWGLWAGALVSYLSVFRLAIAARILLIVLSDATLHSLTRRTDQPSRRSCWETLESRLMFATIFSRQNFLLLRGRYLHEHPCQKHPSTNTATWRPGQAKSGRPAIGQCLRYPRRPASRRIRPNANSVVRLPFERTEAMIFDRTSRETWSIGLPGMRLAGGVKFQILFLDLVGRHEAVMAFL